MHNLNRPKPDDYFMEIALAVRQRADCTGQKVGAVIVMEERIISTGYNGTPENMTNCSDGGCVRCANRGKTYAPGTAYDLCICVHAEQNAILSAARFGIGVQGATLYTTTQPCFGCLKEMLQARISCVHYLHPWKSQRDTDHERQYQKLLEQFVGPVHRSSIVDPREAWATAAGTPSIGAIDQHGMESV